jgi:hypothetical protein
MTNPYRAMCAELLEALEIQLDELRFNNRLCIRARALLDQPVEEKPPADGEVAELQRWGVDHGAQPGRPLLSPMEDGYWTPWHIAADLLQRLASDNAGLEAAAESLYWSNLSLLDSQNDWEDREEEADLIARAETELAQPEPEEPTDEEIMELMPQQMHDDLRRRGPSPGWIRPRGQRHSRPRHARHPQAANLPWTTLAPPTLSGAPSRHSRHRQSPTPPSTNGFATTCGTQHGRAATASAPPPLMPAWPPALIRSITLHRNDYHFCFAVVLDFRLGFPVGWSWNRWRFWWFSLCCGFGLDMANSRYWR